VANIFDHSINKLQLFQNILNHWLINRLWTHSIHSINVCFLLIWITCVSSYRNNNWLRKLLGMQISSNLIGSIVSIKNRHIAIHQDQLVVAFLAVVLSDVGYYFVYSFLSVERLLAYPINILNIKSTIKNDFKCIYVKQLVVYNQNLFASIHLDLNICVRLNYHFNFTYLSTRLSVNLIWKLYVHWIDIYWIIE